MHFAFTEEQEALRETARAFLAENAGPEPLRAAMESELGFDPALWKRIGTELGWSAVAIPEEYGGLGLGTVELVALLEVMGESLLCSPFFASVGLAAQALLASGDADQCAAQLPDLAAGEVTATLAWTGPAGRPGAEGVALAARREGGDVVLSGRHRYVLDGARAERLVVAARHPDSSGSEGVSLLVVPAELPGLSRRPLPTLDGTRRLAELVWDDVRVPATALVGEAESAGPALERALDLAATALAAEQVGGAQRTLDLAVDYAKQRQQFGRPIGSFQAIKHKCADMLLRVESARSAAYHAACVAAEGGADLATAASSAKATCSDAFFACAAECLQIHGGVGFTWEYDVHLYFKRARSSEVFLGDPAHHRERVARRIGLGPPR